MEQQIYKKISNGNLYLISTIAGFFIMFIASSIPLFGAMVSALIVNPSFFGEIDFESILSNPNYLADLLTNAEFTNKLYSLSIFSDIIFKIVSIAAIIFIFRKVLISDVIKFKNNIGRNIGIIILSIVMLYFLSFIVSTIFDFFKIEGTSANEDLIGTMINSPMRWMMFIYVVIIAPFFEEMLFRKFMFGVLEERFRLNGVVAVIVSAVIFSFVHVTDLESTIFIFIYLAQAIPICLAYHISKNNIVVPYIIHVINNLIAFLVYVLPVFQEVI